MEACSPADRAVECLLLLQGKHRHCAVEDQIPSVILPFKLQTEAEGVFVICQEEFATVHGNVLSGTLERTRLPRFAFWCTCLTARTWRPTTKKPIRQYSIQELTLSVHLNFFGILHLFYRSVQVMVPVLVKAVFGRTAPKFPSAKSPVGSRFGWFLLLKTPTDFILHLQTIQRNHRNTKSRLPRFLNH